MPFSFLWGSAYFSGLPVGVKGLPGDKMHMAPTNRLKPSPGNRHADGVLCNLKGFSGLGYGEKVFNWLTAGHRSGKVNI